MIVDDCFSGADGTETELAEAAARARGPNGRPWLSDDKDSDPIRIRHTVSVGISNDAGKRLRAVLAERATEGRGCAPAR